MNRRQFLGNSGVKVAAVTASTLAIGGGMSAAERVQESKNDKTAPDDDFPSQDARSVLDVVRRSHFDFDGVKKLVEARPALAKASWDWGFGDWESALGAASHTGRRNIAELLIAHGARPNLFTAAMLGQLDVVRATLEAQPGIQRELGPHGITLLAHARSGGEQAKGVVTYLESFDDADIGHVHRDLRSGEKARLLGRYVTLMEPKIVLEVVEMRDGMLGIRREGRVARTLFHQGNRVFHPAGAPAVRIEFETNPTALSRLTVHDPTPILSAFKVAS